MSRSAVGLTALLLVAACAASCGDGPTQPGPANSASSGDGGGSVPTVPILSPTVSDITAYAATVTWTTEQPVKTFVDLAANPDFRSPHQLTNTDGRASHTYRFSDLRSNTTYYVRVRAVDSAGRDTSSGVVTFVTLPVPDGAPASSLVVTSFKVIEYQYLGSGDAGWYYAPRLEVKESSGRASAIVIKIDVVLSGYPQSPPEWTRMCIGPGVRVPLFYESYGDYDFAIGYRNGPRVTGDTATVVVTFEDTSGRQGTVTATGPIVPGALPTDGPPSPVFWPCQSSDDH